MNKPLREVVDELSTCYKRLDMLSKALGKYSQKDLKKLRNSSRIKIQEIIQDFRSTRIRISTLKQDLFSTDELNQKLMEDLCNIIRKDNTYVS